MSTHVRFFTGVIIASLLVVTGAGPVDAARKSKKQSHAPALTAAQQKLQGVWKLVGLEEYVDGSYHDIPITWSTEFHYFVVSGTQACTTKARIDQEVSCRNSGSYTFDGKKLESSVRGVVTFQGRRFVLALETIDEGFGGKGGGPMRYTFEKTPLKLMEYLIPENTPVRLKDYHAAIKKNDPKYKRAAEAILKQVPTWKATLEREAATFEVVLNEETLKKTSFGGFEGFYVDVDRWAKRAVQELRSRNHQGAYHFAFMAEDEFRNAQEAIPQHRRAYEMGKKMEAEQRAAAEAPAREVPDEELPPSLRPTPPRAATAQDLTIQGLWQVKEASRQDAATKQWKATTMVDALADPQANEADPNYYFIVRGSTFCNYAKLLATIPEVQCRAYYAPMTFDGTTVKGDAVPEGDSITYNNGQLVLVTDGRAVKLTFVKSDRTIRE